MPEEKLTRADAERLDAEIHEERRSDIRVAADRWFDANEERVVAMLVKANVTALEQWSKAQLKTALATFGLTAFGSMLIAGLIWLGWKGWGGK